MEREIEQALRKVERTINLGQILPEPEIRSLTDDVIEKLQSVQYEIPFQSIDRVLRTFNILYWPYFRRKYSISFLQSIWVPVKEIFDSFDIHSELATEILQHLVDILFLTLMETDDGHILFFCDLTKKVAEDLEPRRSIKLSRERMTSYENAYIEYRKGEEEGVKKTIKVLDDVWDIIFDYFVIPEKILCDHLYALFVLIIVDDDDLNLCDLLKAFRLAGDSHYRHCLSTIFCNAFQENTVKFTACGISTQVRMFGTAIADVSRHVGLDSFRDFFERCLNRESVLLKTFVAFTLLECRLYHGEVIEKHELWEEVVQCRRLLRDEKPESLLEYTFPSDCEENTIYKIDTLTRRINTPNIPQLEHAMCVTILFITLYHSDFCLQISEIKEHVRDALLTYPDLDGILFHANIRL